MGYVIALVVVAIVAFVVWLLWRRFHSPTPDAAAPSPRSTRVADATPMTGLEVALDQVTDRSGRNMREKIEAGTTIDDLRVPDDTGPILRRALDQVEHVEHVEPSTPGAPVEHSTQGGAEVTPDTPE